VEAEEAEFLKDFLSNRKESASKANRASAVQITWGGSDATQRPRLGWKAALPGGRLAQPFERLMELAITVNFCAQSLIARAKDGFNEKCNDLFRGLTVFRGFRL